MMEKKAVLEWIASAKDYELSEIVRAILDRYHVLFPDDEVIFLSLPLRDREERRSLLEQLTEHLMRQ